MEEHTAARDNQLFKSKNIQRGTMTKNLFLKASLWVFTIFISWVLESTSKATTGRLLRLTFANYITARLLSLANYATRQIVDDVFALWNCRTPRLRDEKSCCTWKQKIFWSARHKTIVNCETMRFCYLIDNSYNSCHEASKYLNFVTICTSSRENYTVW